MTDDNARLLIVYCQCGETPSRIDLQHSNSLLTIIGQRCFAAHLRRFGYRISFANSALQRAGQRHTNRRAEAAPEEAILPGFNTSLYAILHRFVHPTLSLFTNQNLRTIAREATVLPTIKVYPRSLKEKLYILDVQKFESEHGSVRKYAPLICARGITRKWQGSGAASFLGVGL